MAGVNDVGFVAQVHQQLAFQFNGLDQVALNIGVDAEGIVARQRVAAPGFGIALNQGVGAGIQKKHAHIDIFLAHQIQLLRQQWQRGGTAHIHGNGDALFLALLLKLYKRAQQFGW